DKESGVRVGEVGLFMRSKDHQGGEVGYVMHPDHAGKGYATEAAKAMLALGFDFFGLNRIMARCDQRNLPSEGVMKAIGMRHEATLIENWRDDDGSWSNELNYAILKREWGAQNPG
ncbi:MAG: N-acetyltransferase, partial [Alphaproteobacteria bacterium]